MGLAVWIGAAFVVGLIVGGGAMALLARGSDAEVRLRRLRREFDRYQQEVADHYGHTAELLTRVRGGFAQLYQHVEQGAAVLVSEDALQRRLHQLEKDTGGAADRVGTGEDRPPGLEGGGEPAAGHRAQPPESGSDGTGAEGTAAGADVQDGDHDTDEAARRG